MVLSLFQWTPTIIDAIVPFLIFTSEVFLAKNIDKPTIWCFAMAAFVLFAFSGYFYMNIQSSKYRENTEGIILSKKRNQLVYIVLLLIFVFSISLGLFLKYFPSKAIANNCCYLYLLIVLGFTIHTYFYWDSKIIKQITNRDKKPT